MTKTLLAVSLVASLGASAALAAGPPPPKGTVSIALPDDAGFGFKPGPGVDAAQRYCLTCHSSAYVSTQPALTKPQWTAEVTKMKAVFGAQIPDDQIAPIADYLTTVYGKPQ
jgi:sulfite dehydrogenase (cytochrome) subunit B